MRPDGPLRGEEVGKADKDLLASLRAAVALPNS